MSIYEKQTRLAILYRDGSMNVFTEKTKVPKARKEHAEEDPYERDPEKRPMLVEVETRVRKVLA